MAVSVSLVEEGADRRHSRSTGTAWMLLWGGWGSWGCSQNVPGRWSRSPNLGSLPHLLPLEEFLDICRSVNWSVDTSSQSNCEILMEEANLIYHQHSWSQFTTLEILEQLNKLRNTLTFISGTCLVILGMFRLWTIQNPNLLSIVNVNIYSIWISWYVKRIDCRPFLWISGWTAPPAGLIAPLTTCSITIVSSMFTIDWTKRTVW